MLSLVFSILQFDYQFKPIFMTPYFNWFHYIRAIGGNFIVQFFSLPILTTQIRYSRKQGTNNRLCISSFVTVIATRNVLLYHDSFTILLSMSCFQYYLTWFQMMFQNQLWIVLNVASLINVLEDKWFNYTPLLFNNLAANA